MRSTAPRRRRSTLAETGVDAFLTVSTWCTWDDVERATGGDVHRPLATRKPERLVDWDVEYYEAVSELTVAAATG